MVKESTTYICQGCGVKVKRKYATPLLEDLILCSMCYTLRTQSLRGANEKEKIKMP